MSLFLITFFLIYSGMHFYAFLKIKSAFDFGSKVGIPLVLFMLMMFLTPFVVRFSERLGLEFVARLMSYIGYTWMGILFLFVSFSVIIDIYRLLLYSGGLISRRDLSHINPSARFSFYAPFLISAVISIYGYFEAMDIRIERVLIQTDKIPKEIGRLRIVQISDVHLGLIVREERLKRILNEVKAANPDIIVSTGDLVDGQINSLVGLVELFKEVNPRYGKFAVTGNHEFYAGLNQALDFTEKAGFKVLRGEGLTVAGLINIAGIDDPAGQHYGLFKEIPERELLLSLPRENFTLLLKHRPVVDKNAIGLFDLQLSGHAHKGQFFPFGLLTRLYYPIDAGQLRLLDHSYLYVNRGAGTWGPPIRFLSPPEVTVIEVIREGRG